MDLPSSDIVIDAENKKRNRQGTLKVDLAEEKRIEKIDDDVDVGAREVNAAMKRLMSAVAGGGRPEDLIWLSTNEAEINHAMYVEYSNKIHDYIVELKQTSNVRKREANWSELPIELLESILKKLIPSEFDISGFRHIRYFKAVCQSWRAAAKSCSSYIPLPRTPICLFLEAANPSLFDPIGNKVHRIRHVFDSLTYPRIYRYPRIVGSSYGWIVILYRDDDSKESKAQLFNPITRASIPIPSTQTLTNNKRGDGDDVSKAVISSNPSCNKNFFVVVKYDSSKLAFYKHGDEDMNWKMLDDDKFLGGLVFHDDHLFASTSKGVTKVWDFKEYPPLQRSPIKDSLARRSGGDTYSMESTLTAYLMESTLTGEILRLEQTGGVDNGMYRDLHIYVEKLNLAEGKWESLRSLGDQSLFFCHTHVLLSLPNPCFLGCEKNSIYLGTRRGLCRGLCREMYVTYNLETERVDVPINIGSFSENVQITEWRRPYWIFPNPW